MNFADDKAEGVVSTEKETQTLNNEAIAPDIRELRDEIRQMLEKGEEEIKKLYDQMTQLQTAVKISRDSIAFLKEYNRLLQSADDKLKESNHHEAKFEITKESDSDAVTPTQVESSEVTSSERGNLSLQSSNTRTTPLVATDERMDIVSDVKKISYQSKALPALAVSKGSMPRSPSFTTRVTALAERQSLVPPSVTKVNVQMIRNHGIDSDDVQQSSNKPFKYPYQLVNGLQNELIVSDRDSHHLVVFDEQLQSSFVFGKRGIGKGTFYNPTGLAVDRVNSYLFVADHNNIIQQFKMKYNSTTKKLCGFEYVKCYGEKGYGFGQLECPCGLAFSLELGLFVCDYGNHRIQVFAKGKIYSFGVRGENDGEFTEPHSIAINKNEDKVFVSDHSNNRIQVFKPNGEFITTIVDSTDAPNTPQLQYPRGIHYTNGRLLVSCTYTHCILEFAEDGTYQSTIEGITQPGGIVLRHDRRIVVTSNVKQALIVLTTT